MTEILNLFRLPSYDSMSETEKLIYDNMIVEKIEKKSIIDNISILEATKSLHSDFIRSIFPIAS